MTIGVHVYFGPQVVTTFEVAKLVEIKIPMPMLYLTPMKDGRLRLEMSTHIGDVGKFTRLELVHDEPAAALRLCPTCGAVRSHRP